MDDPQAQFKRLAAVGIGGDPDVADSCRWRAIVRSVAAAQFVAAVTVRIDARRLAARRRRDKSQGEDRDEQ